MTLSNIEACMVIGKHRDDALIVSTMSAMFGISALSPSPLNVSSVPLMGGASGIGLGLALSRPERSVLVLDGDASLLMELGSLATIAGQAPKNLVHFVFNNNVQFSGLANLTRPGGKNVDFQSIAKAAGYGVSLRISDVASLMAALPDLMSKKELSFVELMITPPQKFGLQTPQPEMPDMQFHRMAAEANAMRTALGVA